ncbi:MAG: pyruvate kinase [Pelagibacteraceae bacterium TMED237]|nr:MAG: pyruvate kinase [Pelagibacteraceae bacterium TMED237]|tara:strand:- start:11515 stop:12609 length:1095 start_codon:yes stop_codon:yes gene_type:complete
MFKFIYIILLFNPVLGFSIPCRKISQIATVGPACNSYGQLKEMHECGVNTFRINMGHCKSTEEFMYTYDNIKSLKSNYNDVKMLIDLQGPKFRIGTFKKGCAILKEDSIFILDKIPRESYKYRVYLPHDEIYYSVSEKDKIYLDDGNIELEVMKVLEENRIITRVKKGGVLKNNKGLNLPYKNVNFNTITPKDAIDIALVNHLGDVDYIALSFVQEKKDIQLLRSLLMNKQINVIAKIETPMAVDNLESIIEESDGILIARGDLGIEMGLEHVPFIQKLAIKFSNKSDKEVIVATQLLETMISNQLPTRAEVSDNVNAILDGATGLMLSAETSIGKYPLKAVKMQRKLIDVSLEYINEIEKIDD